MRRVLRRCYAKAIAAIASSARPSSDSGIGALTAPLSARLPSPAALPSSPTKIPGEQVAQQLLSTLRFGPKLLAQLAQTLENSGYAGVRSTFDWGGSGNTLAELGPKSDQNRPRGGRITGKQRPSCCLNLGQLWPRPAPAWAAFGPSVVATKGIRSTSAQFWSRHVRRG